MFSLFKQQKDNFMDSDCEERAKRLEEKRLKAIEELGNKYLLAPANKVKKLEKPRNY